MPERAGPDGGPLARLGTTLGNWLLAALGLLLLAAAGGIVLVSQTAAGREIAASSLEDLLNGAVEGRVEVGPIVGGNLITRSVLRRFVIEGPDGDPFLTLEDVHVTYDPLGFPFERIQLRSVRAGRLSLHLTQDGEGTWNFDRIFGGDEEETDGKDGEGEGGIVLQVADATVLSGEVEVRIPWAREETGAARRAALAEARSGESIWHFETGSDGEPVQVVRLGEMRGSLPSLRLAHPDLPMRIQLSGVSGLATAVRQSLPIRRLDGLAVFRDTVEIELDEIRTDSSRLEGEGWVASAEEGPPFGFDLEADPVAFSELRWLPVPVPELGGGTGRLALSSDGRTTRVAVAGGDFRSRESRASGGFSLVLEDPPRFEELDVRFDPLRLRLVDELLDRDPGLEGLIEGRVRGSGPVTLFRTEADLRLRPLPPQRGGPAGVRLSGGLALTEPRAFRGLRIEMEELEPRWTRLLGFDTRQEGRVTGFLTLDAEPGEGVSFETDLTHRVPGDTTSRLVGRGRIGETTDEPPDGGRSLPEDAAPGASDRRGERAGGTPVIDVEMEARPLSLSVLDPWFPALDMTGVVRGPFSARGTFADLSARADLETPRGRVSFDGRFDLAAQRRRYDARLTARDIQLDQWFEGGPRTRLAVEGRVEGEGTDPADLEASFDLQVLPSLVEGARVDSSLVRFSVAQGLATADTFALRTDVGEVRGRGSFGLSAGRSGALVLTLRAPDLSTWNRWLVPGRDPMARDTTARDLFERLGAPAGTEGAGERAIRRDTLSGSLFTRGVLFGSVEQAAFGGLLRGREIGFGQNRADSLEVTLDLADLERRDSLVVRGAGRGLARGEALQVDSARFRLERRGASRWEVELSARRDTSAAIVTEATADLGAAVESFRFDRLEVVLAGRRLGLESPAEIRYGETGLTADSFSLVGERGERIRASGRIPDRGEASFDLEVERLELDRVARFARLDERVAGRLSGSVRVRGSASRPAIDGVMAVDGPGYGPVDAGSLAANLRYRDESLEARLLLTEEGRELASVEGRMAIDLAFRDVAERLSENPFDFRVRLDRLPARYVRLFTDGFRDVEGHLTGRTEVRGGPGALRLDGEVELREGAATVLALGARYRRIEGRAVLRGSETRIDSLTLAAAGGGSAEVTGTVSLTDPSDPGLDLDLRARGLQAADRRRISVRLDGRGRLGGSYRAPELTGEFRLSNGTLRIDEFLRQAEVVDLNDPALLALVDTTTLAERRLLAGARNPFTENLRADLTVRLGPDLWLRSPDVSVELRGSLELRTSPEQEDVTAFGGVEIVRGSYRYATRFGYARQLRISGGQLEFVGTPGLDPNVQVTAVHRARTEQGTLLVRAEVGGTLSSPTLTFTSEPALSESDEVCVLLFNAPCAAGPGGQVVGNVLGAFGGQLSGVLAGEAGLDYFNIRSAGPQGGAGGSGAGDDQGPASDIAATEVEVGKYLTPELFLSVSQPLGGRIPDLMLDWRFAESWTAEFRFEERFRQELGASASNIDRDQSWGMFLFRDWTF